MNSLSRLVTQRIRKNNVTQAKLVVLLGFKNINKGIRRLNQLLMNLDDNTRLLDIQKTLKINNKDFLEAYFKSFVELKRINESIFKPILIIHYKKAISFYSRVSTPVHIHVSVDPLFSLKEELIHVCNQYLNLNFKNKSTGFTYYRSYQQKYDFNHHGFLIT